MMNVHEAPLSALDLPHASLRAKHPGHEKNLLSSLSEQGQQSPVIVVREQDRYAVIDGHKRVRALRKLKADAVQVTVWEMGQDEALVRAYQMSAHGSRNAFEEGWLIEVLHRSFRWTLGQIGQKLGRSRSWVSRRLSLAEECPESLTEAVWNGRVGVHAVVAYLVPLRRRNEPEARALVEKLPSLELGDRQVRDVVAAYGAAGVEVRRKIVEDPTLFLKAREAAQANALFNDVENRCVRNLTILGNIAVGLVKNLPEAVGTEGQTAGRQAIYTAWVGCEEKFRWLEKTAAAIWGGAHAG